MTFHNQRKWEVSPPVHTCYEPSWALWIRVPQDFSEWLEIVVCSGNWSRLQQKSSSNACSPLRQKWKQSGNTGVAMLCGCEKLISRMSTLEAVAWKYKACLLHGKGFFLFNVHCLFPRHRHSALCDTLNCDILVTEVPPNSWQTLALVFTTPTQGHTNWSINIFSPIMNPYVLPGICAGLQIKKVRTYVLKNYKLVYP